MSKRFNKPFAAGEKSTCNHLILQDSVPDTDLYAANVRVIDTGVLDDSLPLFAQSQLCPGCKLLPLLSAMPCTAVEVTIGDAPLSGLRAYAPIDIYTTDSPAEDTRLTTVTPGPRAAVSVIFLQSPDSSLMTSVVTDIEPDREWPYLLEAASFFFAAAVVYRFFKKWQRKQLLDSATISVDAEAEPLVAPLNSGPRARATSRIAAIDTLRGFSILLMVFVNYGGAGMWFFNHAPWNGLTVADILFPLFVFIMGVSACVVHHRPTITPDTTAQRAFRILRRSATLFILGSIVSNVRPSFARWRVNGVLQYFSFAYLVNATALLILPNPSSATTSLNDVVAGAPHTLLTLALMVLYIAIQQLLPVPGCPTGYIGAGGLSDGGLYPDCAGGAHRWIDVALWGDSHIFRGPTCGPIFRCGSYDPEGSLGAINAAALAGFGVQAGRIFAHFGDPKSRVKRLVMWGVACGSIALALCGAKTNGGIFPINKNLWSPSFILAMAALGFFGLAICYISVDVKKVWRGAPFLYPGMNAITVYLGHELLGDVFPFSFECPSAFSWFLARNLIGTTAWACIAYVMYRKKIFITV